MTIDRFLEKIDFFPSEHPECWIWTAAKSWGYGYFWYRGKQQRAHRVSYDLFVGPIPDSIYVCHTCDIRSCVNPKHLWLGSHADNHQDALLKGKLSNLKGELHPKAKTTEAIVIRIRAEYEESNISQSELSRKYNVSPRSVSDIVNRKTWKHI